MIWLLGDVHGNFDHITRSIAATKIKPAAVIFLGDIEAPIPLFECCHDIEAHGVEWYWVIGNHDTDTEENYANVSDPKSMAHNIDGRVIAIDGVRIAGLGGIFRGEVWHPNIDSGKPSFANYAEYEKAIRRDRQIKQRLSKQDLVQMQAVPSRRGAADLQDTYRTGKLLKHHSTIFPADYERLADQKADILITHEAPSCHPHGFEQIDLLAQAMGATVYHGHHHDALDYSRHWDTLGIKAFGVGFCGITDQDGNVIAPGDFDEHRRYREQHGMRPE